jgi:hypothetical protein
VEIYYNQHLIVKFVMRDYLGQTVIKTSSDLNVGIKLIIED